MGVKTALAEEVKAEPSTVDCERVTAFVATAGGISAEADASEASGTEEASGAASGVFDPSAKGDPESG